MSDDVKPNPFNTWWWSGSRTVTCAKQHAWEVWQAAVKAETTELQAENERLKAIPGQLISIVEARAKRAREKADAKDPKKVYAAIADAEAGSLESTLEWLRAFMAAKDGES